MNSDLQICPHTSSTRTPSKKLLKPLPTGGGEGGGGWVGAFGFLSNETVLGACYFFVFVMPVIFTLPQPPERSNLRSDGFRRRRVLWENVVVGGTCGN